VTGRIAAAVVVAAAALTGACGGGDEISRGDEAFADRVGSELAEVNTRLGAVADCVDDVRCLRRAGRPLADRANYAATHLADDARALDDPCLRDIGETIVGYFDAAGDVGVAAEAGDLDSVALRSERAAGMGRTIQAEIVACVDGAADHPGLSAAREMNAVFASLADPIDRLEECDDLACVIAGGAALSAAAEAGRERLRAIDREPLAVCQRDALAAAGRALAAYGDAGLALAAAFPEEAVRHFRRAGRAEGDVARATASCVP
jgi:hypothetical protein